MPCRVFFRSICILSAWILAAGLPASAVYAQSTLTGVVSDESGGAINGASITVRDASGVVAHTAITDANGTFSAPSLASGRYQIEAESPLFERARVVLDVSADRVPAPVRVTMKIAGLVERMVVTGRRVETRLSETHRRSKSSMRKTSSDRWRPTSPMS